MTRKKDVDVEFIISLPAALLSTCNCLEAAREYDTDSRASKHSLVLRNMAY